MYAIKKKQVTEIAITICRVIQIEGPVTLKHEVPNNIAKRVVISYDTV